MKVVRWCVLLSVVVGGELIDWRSHGQLDDPDVLSQAAVNDSLIEKVNSMAELPWRAKRHDKWRDAKLGDVKKLMGVLQDESLQFALPPRQGAYDADVPTAFDWRVDSEKSEACASLSEIRDQANCGSCWAFGSTEAMTDRLCIHENVTEHLSSQDVTSCDHMGDMGCDGGVPSTAYTYYAVDGIVTGGNYGDRSGCYMYQLPPCAHHTNSSDYPPCPDDVRTPKCQRACDDDDDEKSSSWKDAKIFGARGYSICDSNENCAEKMAAEIYQNGPITGMFFVHEDFLSYESGVYVSSKLSPMLGGHAIKILGFGTENDVPYWLVANSWNTDWGQDGFFKIRRGSNECQIEDALINGGPVAGLPHPSLTLNRNKLTSTFYAASDS